MTAADLLTDALNTEPFQPLPLVSALQQRSRLEVRRRSVFIRLVRLMDEVRKAYKFHAHPDWIFEVEQRMHRAAARLAEITAELDGEQEAARNPNQ